MVLPESAVVMDVLFESVIFFAIEFVNLFNHCCTAELSITNNKMKLNTVVISKRLKAL